jgi:dihydropteroate synthase
VFGFLRDRVAACVTAGFPPDSLILDPGFGFGKSLANNLALLKHLPKLVHAGHPVLVGFSRKSMIAAISPAPVDDRLPGSLVLALRAVAAGARLLRVHDVSATLQALRVAAALDASPLTKYSTELDGDRHG